MAWLRSWQGWLVAVLLAGQVALLLALLAQGRQLEQARRINEEVTRTQLAAVIKTQEDIQLATKRLAARREKSNAEFRDIIVELRGVEDSTACVDTPAFVAYSKLRQQAKPNS